MFEDCFFTIEMHIRDDVVIIDDGMNTEFYQTSGNEALKSFKRQYGYVGKGWYTVKVYHD